MKDSDYSPTEIHAESDLYKFIFQPADEFTDALILDFDIKDKAKEEPCHSKQWKDNMELFHTNIQKFLVQGLGQQFGVTRDQCFDMVDRFRPTTDTCFALKSRYFSTRNAIDYSALKVRLCTGMDLVLTQQEGSRAYSMTAEGNDHMNDMSGIDALKYHLGLQEIKRTDRDAGGHDLRYRFPPISKTTSCKPYAAAYDQ